MGRNNPTHQYGLEDVCLESSFAEKAFEVLVNTNLNMSQEHVLVAKATRLLDFIRKSIAKWVEGGDPFSQRW